MRSKFGIEIGLAIEESVWRRDPSARPVSMPIQKSLGGEASVKYRY
jgi:hypothetical protein